MEPTLHWGLYLKKQKYLRVSNVTSNIASIFIIIFRYRNWTHLAGFAYQLQYLDLSFTMDFKLLLE